MCVCAALSQPRAFKVRQNIPTDSIRLSDPAILADQKTKMYYLTGTGGMMWRSADLKLWEGPYRTFGDATYLPAHRPTLDGTFWRDTDGKPYMVFCGEWLQNWNGTIEKIELKPDLSGTIGEPKLLFRASDSPWSREKDDQGNITWNKVTDGPWLFRTGTGRLGMLWTSWVYDVYTQGVAYSASGTQATSSL